MWRTIAILFVSGFAGVALAQQAPRSLTREEARAQAAEHAPDVATLAAQAAVAHAEEGVAGLFPNPRVGVGTSVNYLVIADFYVLLPIFGQRETAEDAATAIARVADAGTEVARLDAQQAAALAWIDLWVAQNERELAMDDADRRGRLRDVARARFDEGAVSRLDALRANADARRADAELVAFDRGREAASARLAGVLGLPADGGFIVAAGEPTPNAPRVPSLQALEAILHAHPIAQRAAEGIRAADAVVERDHRSRWPRLGIGVQDWVARDTQDHDLRVLLTMELPLFDEPRITRAERQRVASHAEEDATLLRLRADLVATRADFLALDERCRALAESALPAAREVADLSREAYTSGELDLSSTLAAEQARADAERALLSCRADRARAWARLEHAAGGRRD